MDLLGMRSGPHRTTIRAEAIRAYAEAVADPHPAYREAEAALALGYAGIVAPPTAAALLFIEPLMSLVRAAEGRIDFARLVHGDQSYTFVRPLVAGETVLVTGEITEEYTRGGHLFLVVESVARDTSGGEVVRGTATLVVRGGGPA